MRCDGFVDSAGGNWGLYTQNVADKEDSRQGSASSKTRGQDF